MSCYSRAKLNLVRRDFSTAFETGLICFSQDDFDQRNCSTTTFPGFSLYLEKVPWMQLVTCLLDLEDSRDVIEVTVCLALGLPTEPSMECIICNAPGVDRQKSQRRHALTHTVFSRLNAPGVYLKLGLRDPAFIWSRRLIGVRRLLMK